MIDQVVVIPADHARFMPMRRTGLLATFAVLAAALWLAAAAPARTSVTDGGPAVLCSPSAGQHATARVALSAATLGGDTEGEGVVRPTLPSGSAEIKTPAPCRVVVSRTGSDPAGANRAARQGRSAHPPTAPPARV